MRFRNFFVYVGFSAFVLSTELVFASSWYVRPSSAVQSAISDGKSYATAFKGLSAIVWGANGVKANDILFVCGTFLPHDAPPGWMLQIGASGTSLNNLLTVDGDCSDNSDFPRARLEANLQKSGIHGNNNSFLRIRNIHIANTLTRGIYLPTTGFDGSLVSGSTIEDVMIHNVVRPINGTSDADCIWGKGSGATIQNIICDGADDDGIWWSGNNFVASNNTIKNIGLLANVYTGDCIQLYKYTADFRLLNNVCDHRAAAEKQCFIVQDDIGSTGGIMRGNTCLMPLWDSTQPLTKDYFLNQPGVTVENNYAEGGKYSFWIEKGGLIISNLANNPYTTGIFVYANAAQSSAKLLVKNNTVNGQIDPNGECYRFDGSTAFTPIDITAVNNTAYRCQTAWRKGAGGVLKFRFNLDCNSTVRSLGFFPDASNEVCQ